MRWRYYFVSFDHGIYEYEYIREKAESRGVIRYNILTDEGEVVKPCSSDTDCSTDAVLRHFYKVVDAGFPKEYAVSCG